MKAMVLAAGEGTRLRPLTLTVPKALLPVAGVPVIRHTLVWLRSHGIREVAINLHHLGDMVRDTLGDGSDLGMQIRYSPEQHILGTAEARARNLVVKAITVNGFATPRLDAIYGNLHHTVISDVRQLPGKLLGTYGRLTRT